MYLTVKDKFDSGIRASYSITEDVEKVTQLKHPLIRSAMQLTGIDKGVEVASMADVPKGTGLGSSSSFTVCLLHALNSLRGKTVSADYLAREACKIEIEMCNEPIGKQDQYAAAFGGINEISFHAQGTVSVSPVSCSNVTQENLNHHMLLFYTGKSRSASSVLAEQSYLLKTKTETVRLVDEIKNLCDPFLCAMKKNDIETMGKILSESWNLKRKTAKSVSNDTIEEYIKIGRRAGAYGGKLLGAGNGGFIMFLAPPETHNELRTNLGSRLKEMPVKTHPFGSQIIYQTD